MGLYSIRDATLYSSRQENIKIVKSMFRRLVLTSSFIVYPMMVGLAVIAEPLNKLILTDKWLPCFPFLQIYCAIYALMPIHIANLQAIKALGHSDTILKLEVLKKAIDLIVLFISLFIGIYAIAIGGLIISFIATLINSYPNKRYLNYRFKEHWKDIMPSLILSFAKCIIVYNIKFIGLTTFSTLIIQVCLGLVVYLVLAKEFKLDSLTYLMYTIVYVRRNKEK